MAKIAVFWALKLQNLSDSKIHKFPHCVEETKVLTYLEYHEMSLKIQLIFRLKTNFHSFHFSSFFSLLFVLRLLFTFSNFVYKTEQLKAHALLALETFCFDFFSVFENTNKNVNFRFEAQSLAEFTHFYHFYPQPRIEVSGTKVQNHDFKTLKVD